MSYCSLCPCTIAERAYERRGFWEKFLQCSSNQTQSNTDACAAVVKRQRAADVILASLCVEGMCRGMVPGAHYPVGGVQVENK